MGITLTGARGEPVVASSGNTPTFAADLTDISAFFAVRSLRRFSTVALLLASSGSTVGDAAVADNAPGGMFVHTGSGWFMHGVARFADSAARNAALTAPAAGWKSRLASEVFDREYDGSVWQPLGGDVWIQTTTFTNSQSVVLGGLPSGFTAFEFDVISEGVASIFSVRLWTTGGADVTAANYERTEVIGRQTTQSTNTVITQDRWALVGWANTHHHHKIELEGITQAIPTRGRVQSGVYANPAAVNAANGLIDNEVKHSLSTIYGGIRLIFSGDQTGYARVKGIR